MALQDEPRVSTNQFTSIKHDILQKKKKRPLESNVVSGTENGAASNKWLECRDRELSLLSADTLHTRILVPLNAERANGPTRDDGG